MSVDSLSDEQIENECEVQNCWKRVRRILIRLDQELEDTHVCACMNQISPGKYSDTGDELSEQYGYYCFAPACVLQLKEAYARKQSLVHTLPGQ